jgi:predicted transposase/invertase (TIGR01784 family)
MFDNVCKFLAETFSTDFATWLLGEPIRLTQLSPSELSLEPIRADTLILLESSDVVLHLEFQTQPIAEIPFRMIDYRLRVYRRFPQKQMRQVVLYLRETKSDLVQQNCFTLENTEHRFEVVRLWEQPVNILLQYPGLLPFAVLGQTSNRVETLQQVAQQIEGIDNQRLQSSVAASTAILAGLVLEKALIQRLLRRELMQDSVIYQSIREEAIQEGIQQGLAQGIRQVALNLLSNGMLIDEVARMTGLSVEQVRSLQTKAEPQSGN